jgi:tetratricopeptide (TPR) repeat protein
MSEPRSGRRARLRSELENVHEPRERLARLIALAEELTDGAALEGEPLMLEAQTLARQLEDKAAEAAVEKLLANIAWRSGDAATATGHAKQALELARAAGDAKQQASAWSLLCMFRMARAEYDEARRCGEQCLEAARRANYQLGVQSALNELGNIALLQGRPEEALRHYQECLQLNEETGDRYSSAGLHVNVGLVLEQLGRWEDAAGSLSRAVGICEEQDFGDIGSYALNALGELLLKRGKAEQAVGLFEQVVAAGRARRTTVVVMRDGLVNLGRARMRAGDMAGARQAFAEALALCREAQDRRSEVVCLVRMAELAVHQGEVATATRLAAEAQSQARELNLRTEEGEALLVYALVAAGGADRQAARNEFNRVLDVLGTGEETYETARARFEYGRFLMGESDLGAAREHLGVAASTFRRLAAADEARAAGRLLFELDLRGDCETALLQAVSGLGALGLEPDQHIDEALAMLCTALRCERAAIVAGDGIVCSHGSAPAGAWAACTEPAFGPAGVCLPLRVPGCESMWVRLERSEPQQVDCSQAVVETVVGLLAVPVQRLLAGRAESRG